MCNDVLSSNDFLESLVRFLYSWNYFSSYTILIYLPTVSMLWWPGNPTGFVCACVGIVYSLCGLFVF